MSKRGVVWSVGWGCGRVTEVNLTSNSKVDFGSENHHTLINCNNSKRVIVLRVLINLQPGAEADFLDFQYSHHSVL